MTQSIESYINDYLESVQFLVSGLGSHEQVDSILISFVNVCKDYSMDRLDELSESKLLDILTNAKQFERLEVALRRLVPNVLVSFFDYLVESGTYPPAVQLSQTVSLQSNTYAASIREDGSVKGETYRKKYTDVSRNDPCPCGSGIKFKKCCMGLIE